MIEVPIQNSDNKIIDNENMVCRNADCVKKPKKVIKTNEIINP